MKLKPLKERTDSHHRRKVRRERERAARTRRMENDNIWSAFSYNGPRIVFPVYVKI